MNLMDIMLKTNAIRKEKPQMEKDLMQALINHLNADADKISKAKLPIGDVGTINELLDVMQDIKAVANTLRREFPAPPTMEELVPMTTEPQEAEPTEETEKSAETQEEEACTTEHIPSPSETEQ